MRVEVCKSGKEWDELLKRCDGTVFHTWSWLKTMERHSKKKIMGRWRRCELIPLKFLDGEVIVGICPLFVYNGTIKYVFSPPMGVETLYLGPLVLDVRELKRSKREARTLSIVEQLHEYIELLKPNFVLIHTLLKDIRPFKWLGYEVEPRYTYVMKMKSIDDVWKGYHRSLRRGVEKARRKGITVREGGMEDLKHIYTLLKERNRIHTTEDFVLDVYNKFNVRVFIAEKDGVKLSGIVNLCYGNRVAFWIGAPKFTLEGVNPNEIVFYESMRWACEEGYEYYEIMGADDRSLYDFKRKFNCDLEVYFTVRSFRPSILKVAEAIYRTFKPRYG